MIQPDPALRQAICFALDTSRSMAGEKIDALNAGLSELFGWGKAKLGAGARIDVAAVTFGPGVQTVLEFSRLAQHVAPSLTAGGATPMGQAVEQCLTLIDKYLQDSTQPPAILVIVADGRSTDDTLQAAALCRQWSQANRLVVYPIAIGQDADASALAQFAPGVRVRETSASAMIDVLRELGGEIMDPAKRGSVFDKVPVPWNEAMRTDYR